MRRYILETKQVIHPFESPAAKLPVLNKTIFEHQEDVFRHLKIKEKPFFISSLEEIIPSTSQTLVYRDDIYFNKELVLEFLNKASAIGKPARIAFLDTDPCFSVHACYPQHNMEHVGNLYLGDFFFFPAEVQERDFIPVIIDTESISLSCFSLPSLESGSGQRLSNNSACCRGSPHCNYKYHDYLILLSSIGHSYFLPILHGASIVKYVN